MPKDYEGVVVCVFIEGMFGSVFSKHKGRGARNYLKRREVNIYFSTPFSLDLQHHEAREIVISMKEKYAKS
jgi:hypothetical protein